MSPQCRTKASPSDLQLPLSCAVIILLQINFQEYKYNHSYQGILVHRCKTQQRFTRLCFNNALTQDNKKRILMSTPKNRLSIHWTTSLASKGGMWKQIESTVTTFTKHTRRSTLFLPQLRKSINSINRFPHAFSTDLAASSKHHHPITSVLRPACVNSQIFHLKGQWNTLNTVRRFQICRQCWCEHASKHYSATCSREHRVSYNRTLPFSRSFCVLNVSRRDLPQTKNVCCLMPCQSKKVTWPAAYCVP